MRLLRQLIHSCVHDVIMTLMCFAILRQFLGSPPLFWKLWFRFRGRVWWADLPLNDTNWRQEWHLALRLVSSQFFYVFCFDNYMLYWSSRKKCTVIATSRLLPEKVVHILDVPIFVEMKSFQKPLVKLELFSKFQIMVLPKRDHFYQCFAKDRSIWPPL